MLNRCEFIGHLGADPEFRRLQSGKPVGNMRLAVTEKWRDANGERKEKTEWITIVVFSEGLCKVAENYLRKGSKIYVCGSWQTRRWQDQAGNDRFATELVLSGYDGKLIMLDGPSQSSRSDDRRDDHHDDGNDMDDEIPF